MGSASALFDNPDSRAGLRLKSKGSVFLAIVLVVAGGLIASRVIPVQNDVATLSWRPSEEPISNIKPTYGQNLVFGPVIERVLQARQAGTNTFLDLDTGRLLTPPASVPVLLGDNERSWKTQDISEHTSQFRYIQWLRENGLDLMFSEPDELIGFDAMFPLAHGDYSTNWEGWDDLTPAQIEKAVAVIEWDRRMREAKRLRQPVPQAPKLGGIIRSASQLGSTSPGGRVVNSLTLKQSALWYFKTREGGSGVLHITGFTDNMQGVKIRYKLVQTPPPIILYQNDETRPTKTVVEIKDFNPDTIGDGAQDTTEIDPVGEAVFGPVIERVLVDRGVEHGEDALQLASGNLISIPPAVRGKQYLVHRWMLSAQADLVLDELRSEDLLISKNVDMAEVSAEFWDSATPAEVVVAARKTLSGIGRDTSTHGGSYWLPQGPPVLTLAFVAHGGAKNLLQIIGYVENPHGAIIRYKLVSEEGRP